MKRPPPLYARHPHPRTARPALIGAPFLLFLLIPAVILMTWAVIAYLVP